MRWLLLTLLIAGCVDPFTKPPTKPVVLDMPLPVTLTIVSDDGRTLRENDPFGRPPLRRADHDLQATQIARGVALLAEPAEGIPIYASNLINAALVRRFAGHMTMTEALSASEVFLIRPFVSNEVLLQTGTVSVDWQLQTGRGRNVEQVYATRRTSGVLSRGDPWTAFTAEDAEHLAIQTAAQLLQTASVIEAIERAAGVAASDATPTPTPATRAEAEIISGGGNVVAVPKQKTASPVKRPTPAPEQETCLTCEAPSGP